jgi:hypothetical protein
MNGFKDRDVSEEKVHPSLDMELTRPEDVRSLRRKILSRV